MRKRSCDRIFDNIFWYTIYLLPIIFTVVQSIGIFKNMYFDDWVFIYDNSSLSDYPFMNVLYENLYCLGFGVTFLLTDFYEFLSSYVFASGALGDVLIIYFEYFIFVNLCHVFIDFILFIPRLCHKWMNAFTRTED